MRKALHAVRYALWLIKEIFAAGWAAITLAWRPNAMDPVLLHYPLRVTSDWDIFWFSTSITATPGTLSLGLRHPAAPGEPTVLLVHAVEGSDVAGVFESLADMEERLNPSVAKLGHGVPGQAGYSGPLDTRWYDYPEGRNKQ